MNKYVSLSGLEYYTKLMKWYIDVKINLSLRGKSNCPNCGAAITDMKCDYCGTNFEAIMKIGGDA